MARTVTRVVAALLVLLVGVGAYRWWAPRYTVTREEDGSAVNKVVVASLAGANALKVASVAGTVQSVASASRMGGLLTADQVVKAPFTVDYTIDLSRLRTGDVTWDAAHRILSVDVPEVEAGAPNIDLSHATLVSTRGLFVTRSASAEMFQAGAGAARRTAETEARKPQWLALARDNARRDLERLLAAPLAAAGVPPRAVHVVFPYERRGPDMHWDVSRSVEDVLHNRH